MFVDLFVIIFSLNKFIYVGVISDLNPHILRCDISGLQTAIFIPLFISL